MMLRKTERLHGVETELDAARRRYREEFNLIGSIFVSIAAGGCVAF